MVCWAYALNRIYVVFFPCTACCQVVVDAVYNVSL